MDDLRRAFVEQIRRADVAMSPALAAAFAAVPRDAFVPDGFRRRDGTWAAPEDRDFRPLVYRDDVLVTKLDDGVPVSSSSQPSLMAVMIGALDVRPGQRILEIGAGTGYNAALLASLGAAVTTVDVQADVAARARAALARAHISDVRVEHGDGYAGRPGDRFDRVIVTVGVAGVSPRWLEQLAPDGRIVAPVEHAGTQPVLSIRHVPLVATAVCPAGFMTAAGPLSADHPGAFPAAVAAGSLDRLAEYAPARFAPPLDTFAYRDLWFAAGAWNRRATHAAVPGRPNSCLVLLDEQRTGGAVLLPDGAVLVAGPDGARFGAEAVGLLDRWIGAGRPPMQAWRIGFGRTADPLTPIWVPTSWLLAD